MKKFTVSFFIWQNCEKTSLKILTIVNFVEVSHNIYNDWKSRKETTYATKR